MVQYKECSQEIKRSELNGCSCVQLLWFKFILGLMFFELVSILFAIVPDYGNEYMTKENKN